MSRAVVDAINASGVVPFRRFTPAEARAQLRSLRQPRPPVPRHPMAEVSEEVIDVGDGPVPVRILRPRVAGPGERMPAVIYFHGGGFFAGDLDQCDLIVRQIALEADVVVVNVAYRLAPEHKFPTAVNDALAALEWTVAHADRLGIDPARVVLAGDSAGGNLAIVTALQARARGGPAVAFQVLIYPAVDHRPRADYPSRTTRGGGEFFLGSEDIEWMLDQYFTDRAEGQDWRASPILAPSYAGLPPALVITASHDPLVDEGRHFAERLEREGVRTEYVCFDGTIHGFVNMAAAIPAGAEAMRLICDWIKREVWGHRPA